MARFKYMGEVARPTVIASYGPCKVIKIPKKDGTKMVINAPNQETGFVIGEDIGVDITDEKSLRMMAVDPRFVEIV